MVSNKQVLDYVASRIGQGYANAYGYQCLALIAHVNVALNIGWDTFSSHATGGAQYAYKNRLPAGWRHVDGDPYNDANAQKIWDSLPNGAVVFFQNPSYGHVAIKSDVWGSDRDSLNQNVGNVNMGFLEYAWSDYAKIRYFSCTKWVMGGGAGFLGAWVSTEDDTPPSNTTKKPKTQEEKKQNKDMSTDSIKEKANEIYELALDTTTNVIDAFTSLLNNDVFTNGTNEQFASNSLITINKKYNNIFSVSLNPKIFDDLKKNINDKIEKIEEVKDKITSPMSETVNTSIKPLDDTNETYPQSTQDEVLESLIKLLLKYEPKSNVYGIAGVVSGMMAESSLNPKKFEADPFATNKNYEIKPVVENLFPSWSYFQSLYSFPLNESVYLVDGLHWHGIGLIQWTGTRAKALYDFAGQDPKKLWLLETQIDFSFNGDGTYNAQMLRNTLILSEYVDEGVNNANRFWIRAGDVSSYTKRYAYGHEFFPKIQEIYNRVKR